MGLTLAIHLSPIGLEKNTSTWRSRHHRLRLLDLAIQRRWVAAHALATLSCWNGVTFPTDNFTVETWFKSFGGPNHGSYASIFGAWSHPTNHGWMFGYNMNNNDGTVNLDVMHKLYSDTYKYESVDRNALSSWSHVAMVKRGSTIYWYINGKNVKAHSDNGYTWGGHTQFYCGGSGIRDAAYGTYSNFRISNVARYTQDFTPPSTHFEADANTSAGTPRPRVQRLQRQQRQYG